MLTLQDISKETSLTLTAGILGSITTATIIALAIKYPNRTVFDNRRNGLPRISGWPLVGALAQVLYNGHAIHDFYHHHFTKADTLTIELSAIGLPPTIITIDPRNVEHILKRTPWLMQLDLTKLKLFQSSDNFENYVKGPQFNDATEDLLGHGIFNANGEQWRYQRKTASHIFNIRNFRDHFTEVFVQEIREMQKSVFDVAVEKIEVVDFHDTMFKFTLDSFILLGFGIQLNSLKTKEKIPFAIAFDACQTNSFHRFINPLWRITETADQILRPWKPDIKQHLRKVNAFADEVIENRRGEIAQGKNDHQDLLSRFMNSKNEHGEPLNNKELRDIVLNFIIAGRDTTAQALSWIFYNLMLHPRIEAKLLDEIGDNICEDMDAPTLYEVIKGMKYAHAVFYEGLRLHPSVPDNQKYALHDDILPDGTPVHKGDYIEWSTWSMARSEKVWGADAKEFRPERWITSEGDIRRESQGKFNSFNGGPRVCLGQNLATLEGLVAMTSLLKRYKFSLVPNQEITYQVSLSLPMKNGMKVTVQHR
ncbi:Protein kinase alk2 [Apophysomyces ossiformis]|uniref:Protein kinase alk2 n=1 Tax=Apophysomyces ossiformis TaxID=679940 RepID=A0A8H7BQF8_9FUNG|nr:Protein kinase alk2 [Apophysomyces ossiformis]